MKRSARKKMRQRLGRPPYDLLDEAAHLLRMAPLATHLWYAAGSVPFVLGLLYFWADMSRSAFAVDHVGAASLGMALLFTWMKTAQSVFCGRLLAQAAGAAPRRLGWRGLGRVWMEQTPIHALGIPTLALAAVVTFPLPWAMAFFQNATVLGANRPDDDKGLLSRAWRQTFLWPGQMISVLTILSLFGFFVLLNLALLIYLLPHLVKMLLGIESVFTSSGFSMFNTTFLAALTGLTYLCFDPYVKAAFVLRCYYGESLTTGDDLLAELRSAAAVAVRPAALFVLMALMLWPGGGAQAEEPAGGEAPRGAAVSPAHLDEALRDVIQERRFAWRMPREDAGLDRERDDEGQGAIAKFFTWWRDFTRESVKSAARGAEKVFEWIGKLFRPRGGRAGPGMGMGAMASAMRGLMWFVIAALLVIALFFAVKLIMHYKRPSKALAEADRAGLPPVIPDVGDEGVSADQLPEDEWLALARELWGRGEGRLALRALYLGGLAALGRRELLQIARHKSNRDYERELRRRAHAAPEALDVFLAMAPGYEQVWYGRHEATAEAYERFLDLFETLRVGWRGEGE